MRRATAPAVALLVVLAGCTSNAGDGSGAGSGDGGGDPRAISVDSSTDGCDLSVTSAPAGTLTFEVTNSGSQVTEFYLLDEAGLRVLGEVENIGPQLSRQLVVAAPEGSYTTACKPGMAGDGIRAGFTVEASADEPTVAPGDQQAVDQATTAYRGYVKDQAEQLLTATDDFASALSASVDEGARQLYPQARIHWERIETVAESFGDLDPRLDLREADLAPGDAWTGWHRLEKDLWPARAAGYTPLTPEERSSLTAALVADTDELVGRIRDLTFTVDQIANGARGLLEEVAKSKVTGEEEYWSRTDLWDFQGNIDGAKVAVDDLGPVLEAKDPALASDLAARFEAIQGLLDQHRSGDGFVSYDDLTPDQVKALAQAVDALAEPLSRVTAAVLS